MNSGLGFHWVMVVGQRISPFLFSIPLFFSWSFFPLHILQSLQPNKRIWSCRDYWVWEYLSHYSYIHPEVFSSALYTRFPSSPRKRAVLGLPVPHSVCTMACTGARMVGRGMPLTSSTPLSLPLPPLCSPRTRSVDMRKCEIDSSCSHGQHSDVWKPR